MAAWAATCGTKGRARLTTAHGGELLGGGGSPELGPSRVRFREQRGDVWRLADDTVGGRRLNHSEFTIDGSAHQPVQFGARDRGVAASLDAALSKIGDVNHEAKHVGVGRHAGVPAAFCTGEVFLRSGEASLGRLACGFCRDHATEGLGRGEHQRRRRLVRRCGSDVALKRGASDGRALPAAVKEQLLDAEARVEETGGVGVIECVDGEVRRRKPTRRQQ